MSELILSHIRKLGFELHQPGVMAIYANAILLAQMGTLNDVTVYLEHALKGETK